MKHIIFLKKDLNAQGGLEKYSFLLAKAFQKSGLKVTFLTASQEPLINDFNAISLPCKSRLNFIKLKQFDLKCQEWINKNQCDIVFGLDRNFFQTHYRAGNGVHAEFIKIRSQTESFLKKISILINPMHRLILKMERETYTGIYTQRIFTNSLMVKKEIATHYKQSNPDKIKVVHNGVEWKDIQNNFEEWTSQKIIKAKEFGLNPNLHQLLFIGHGFKRKGLWQLLEALKILEDKKWQLSVVGKDREIYKFRKWVSKNHLQDRVIFWGARKDSISFYQIADTTIIPSLYDPFANVTVESLAMGVYVITSEKNGGKEVINDYNGIVVDVYSPKNFAKTISKRICQHKDIDGSTKIRNSVKHLDFSIQLNKIVQETVNSIGA